MQDFFWEGLIIAIVLGTAFGSYATSLIYRLPNHVPWFAQRHPYCPACDTDLETRDLFPLISFWINRRKCRFCAAPIPTRYFVVELACTLSSVIPYLWLGYTEQSVLLTLLGCCLTILICIYHTHRALSHAMLVALITLGIAYRVLLDNSILPFVIRLFLLMISGLAARTLAERITKKTFGAEWVVLGMALSLWIW